MDSFASFELVPHAFTVSEPIFADSRQSDSDETTKLSDFEHSGGGVGFFCIVA